MKIPDLKKKLPDLKKKLMVSVNEIWRTVFRHGFKDTPRNRALIIISNVWLHLHPTQVREHGTKIRFTWCMGGITFFVFLFELVTGILLMYYYTPDVNKAYADIADLMHVVPYGRLLRNTHRWGAHAMVITVSIHMLRVFLSGSYKAPRQFNWVIGVLLLLLTFLLSFTGYLLPWDQLGYWAITVGMNMGRATPFLGYEGPFANLLGMTINNDIRFALIGGTTIGAPALLRAYVWHCVAIPLIAAALMMIHFWRIRKDGGISGRL
ncbi:MAG TPA: cytochrome b N-terminal domain-containing protein [Candidatus Marinimicrobia bacterium]|jgi:quinol-cytochrome oxidoreductase complex cytochrome b subunit|nr:cytochrome b N-terminal domain-containing protein [Candidatus Neomarinimicrobiota bacterium]